MQGGRGGAISPAVTVAEQLPLDLHTAPALRREDLVVSPSNADTVARARAWRTWTGAALALVGPAGVGKSHLAGVWADEAAAARLAADTPTAGFPPPGTAVLVEDADRGAHDATLFHLIDRAGRGEGALLLTARSAPAAWACALPDLRSRLNALAVARLEEPDDALFEALLRKFFRERQARPSPELLRWLGRRVERSAQAAREVVARLDAASAHGRIGLGLARAVLGEAADDAQGPAPAGGDAQRD